MIPKITKGSDVKRLLRYLFGPGNHNEHRDQHVVAGYEDASVMEPPRADDGRVDVRPLAADLMAPLALASRVPSEWVWHCSLSLRREEGQLSDERWREIGEAFVAEMGFAGDQERAGCRWVAVRHGLSVNGNDHIHLAVTLVTEDGRPARVHNDFVRAQQAVRRLEERFGLESITVRDGRSRRTSVSRAELDRAKRLGDAVPDRVWLRHQVRVAAATARGEAEWVANMRSAGVLVRPRVDASDPTKVTGYAVARAARQGDPVWFGGSKLDGELSLPKVRRRWGTGTSCTAEQWKTTAPAPRREEQTSTKTTQALRTAANRVDEVTRVVPVIAGDPSDVQAVAGAGADVMSRVAAAAEPAGYGHLTRSADALARAAVPSRDLPPRAPSRNGQRVAAELVTVAAIVAAAGHARDREQLAAMLALIHAVGRLAEAIGELQEACNRRGSAGAARTARTHLTPVLDAAAAKGLHGVSSPPGAPQRAGDVVDQTGHRDLQRRQAREDGRHGRGRGGGLGRGE